MEELLKQFWNIYDVYIQTEDKDLRQKLSNILSQIETRDRRTQLLRPEKGWEKIEAWQVLRTQEFIFSDSSQFFLNEGEIIAWTPWWDRDVFLTRIPFYETISGRFLKPGFKLDHEDKGDSSDYDWNQIIRSHGLTDERGLYLPLYEFETIIKFSFTQIEEAKRSVIEYFKKEKGYIPPLKTN